MGLGPLKYDAKLSWLFGESDSAMGLRSNAGGQLDILTLGVIVHHSGHVPIPDLKIARRLRRIMSMFARLPQYYQQVLMIWYTQRWINGKSIVTDSEVEFAHIEWRRVGCGQKLSEIKVRRRTANAEKKLQGFEPVVYSKP